MAFFEQAITVLQTLVIALGAGLGIWGVINQRTIARKIMKKEDSRNHAPGNRAADCSGFCMPMKHEKPIF